MNKKQISVVVPTWNSAATLDWTLLSLRRQRDCDVHIVVADSGSTDGTLEICKHWNVPTVYMEPGNMYRAINVALRQCQSEWLTYLNSDDWVYPDSLARLIYQGEVSGADIVYGNCDYTDGLGRFLYSFAAARPDQLLSLFCSGIFGFAQQSAIFRKQVYQQQNGFDESYTLSADYDFYFRAFLCDSRFVHLAGPTVACFRLHAKQLTNTKAKEMEAEIHTIRSSLARNISVWDRATVALWRLANLPHDAIRLLRMSLLSGRIRLFKSNVASDKRKDGS